MICVVQLGLIDYATGLRLQQRLVEMRKEARVGDVLLLLEHSPVITLGRNARAANVLVSTEQLAKRGVERLECDRGGDVTFHGPGQLVAYPIFDLHGFSSSDPKRKNLGAVEFVRRLEEVLIRTCAAFGISTERVKSLTGVWTCASGSETRPHLSSGQAKIAAIGVHISRAVTSHGFALNVNTDLDYFKLIVPCGITSKPVTSMQKQLGRKISLDEVASTITRHFGEVFGTEIAIVDTLEELTGNATGVPMKPPADLRKLHEEEQTFWA
ncbi:MAG: octanoyltransferase [Acidobacteria bacterium]|nr:MAG: octanoyltransferase [Acidobacteriota bacterium]PYY10283.1 MAG: octanoyltransferase [Acidobacteriota bacterium]